MDYQKHRENLANISPKKWKGIVAEDYGLLVQIPGSEKPMTKRDIKTVCNLINDAAELVDKSEKWDKVNAGLAVDGLHTSPGLLKELFELRDKFEEQDNAVEVLKELHMFVDSLFHYDTGEWSPYKDEPNNIRDLKRRVEIFIIAADKADPAPVEEGKE